MWMSVHLDLVTDMRKVVRFAALVDFQRLSCDQNTRSNWVLR